MHAASVIVDCQQLMKNVAGKTGVEKTEDMWPNDGLKEMWVWISEKPAWAAAGVRPNSAYRRAPSGEHTKYEHAHVIVGRTV